MNDQGRAYSFGGSCASQGQWVQIALDGNRKIQGILGQLKDNPDCRGLGETLRALTEQTQKTFSEDQFNNKSNRLSNLPNEIRALRGFVSSNSTLRNDVFKLLMDRGIEGAMLAAEVGAKTPGSVDGKDLFSFGERSRRAGLSGLDLIEGVANHLPRLEQCLINPDYTGQVLAGAIQMVASFVNIGPSFSQRVSNLISKVMTTMNDRKYTSALRKLKEAEFMTSVRCLLETTSEAYCAALDAKNLFTEMNRSMMVRSFQSKERHDSNSRPAEAQPLRNKDGFVLDDPFQGFYLLINQVPIVTAWLQKIQIGVEPRLDQDASFQGSVINTVSSHLQKVKSIQGSFNKEFRNLELRQTPEARKAQIIQMLRALVSEIGYASGQNFFLISKQDMAIPFFLVTGKDDVPDQVAGKVMPTISWETYMIDGSKYRAIPGFEDPIALAHTIRSNLDKLIAAAQREADAYYSEWFIVDKAALVNEARTSYRYTVVESLQHILGYLANLRYKIERHGGDSGIIPMIAETQTRIVRVLDAFKELKTMRVPYTDLDEETLSAMKEKHDRVVNTVFEQFNVMLQRSGYIGNRLSLFVYHDYTLMLKRGVDFSRFREELFYATGQSILDRMVQLYSDNPAHMRADIEDALILNKRNIEAVEEIFKHSLVAYAAKLKMQADGKRATFWNIYFDSLKRAITDAFVSGPELDYGRINRRWFGTTQSQRETPAVGALRRYLYPFLAGPIVADRVLKYPDLYPNINWWNSSATQSSSPGSPGNPEMASLARLCVQSLAFNDWKMLLPFCDGLKLYPYFIGDAQEYEALQNQMPDEVRNTMARITMDYNARAVEYLGDTTKSVQDRERFNHSSRICAFRDWGRRSFVVWQTILMEKNPLFNADGQRTR